MNGAERLLRTARNAGIDVCFANPGTTEMPLVVALARWAGPFAPTNNRGAPAADALVDLIRLVGVRRPPYAKAAASAHQDDFVLPDGSDLENVVDMAVMSARADLAARRPATGVDGHRLGPLYDRWGA